MSEQTLDVTTGPAEPVEPVGAPRWSGLLRSELRRARSRRSLRWMVGMLLLGVIAVSAILFATTGPVGPQELEQAVTRAMAEQQRYYEECMTDPGIPEADREASCWKPTEADIRSSAIYYVSPQPFSDDSMTGLLVFAGGMACVVALLIGASAGGADWGARTMGLLFSWEPRRLRVFVTRLLVVLLTGVVVTALSVALAWALGALIAGAHPLDPGLRPPDDSGFSGAVNLSDAAEMALRWLPLGVLAAAGGYGVAMATRSTGWAIGATIALIVIMEPFVMLLWPWASQWLVQTNIVAWVSGGMSWLVDPGASSGFGSSSMDSDGEAGMIFISQWRAMTVLVIMVGSVLAVAGTLLRRRDVD